MFKVMMFSQGKFLKDSMFYIILRSSKLDLPLHWLLQRFWQSLFVISNCSQFCLKQIIFNSCLVCNNLEETFYLLWWVMNQVSSSRNNWQPRHFTRANGGKVCDTFWQPSNAKYTFSRLPSFRSKPNSFSTILSTKSQPITQVEYGKGYGIQITTALVG